MVTGLKVYVLNQNYSIRRWINIQEQAKKYNLNLIRVRPIVWTDPQFLSLRESWNVSYSCELSLQLTVARLLETNDEPFLLLEDDVIFDSDPTLYLENIKSLPEDFSLAYLGCYIRPDRKGHFKNYNNYYNEIVGDQMIWGCHSVLFNPKECKELSSVWSKGKVQAIDGYISLHYLGTKKCYISKEMIAFQSGDLGFHGTFSFEKMKNDSINIYNKNNKNLLH